MDCPLSSLDIVQKGLWRKRRAPFLIYALFMVHFLAKTEKRWCMSHARFHSDRERSSQHRIY
jgi:hypothetical protein